MGFWLCPTPLRSAPPSISCSPRSMDSKLDNRGTFGSKRSRNDASKSDGDWTCHQCGNVNFSFRTECNRQHCRAARPSASPQRMGSMPLPGAFGHPTSPYYGSAGVPLSMPYNMSRGYGALVPMHHDYGPPMGMGPPSPYGLISAYGPPGSMGGMGYGPGLAMSQYGYGYRGSPLPVAGSWTPEVLPDNNTSRKRRGGPDGLYEGDWICPKCDNVNFAFRTTCNMKKCGTVRPTPPPSRGGNTPSNDQPNAPDGSWSCSKCNNLNYPFRTVCNRKGCGAEKSTTSN